MSRRPGRWRDALLLAGFPARFRARHGEALLQAYRDACLRRPASRLALTLDLAIQGLLARIELRRRRAGRSPDDLPDRRSGFMDRLLQDLRYGLRTLPANPIVTIVILATLALGIGANTAIFAVINAVILRPLPVPDPARVLVVYSTNAAREIDRSNVAWPTFEDLVTQAERIERGGVVTFRSRSLTAGEYPERLRAALVGGDLFGTLGLALPLGRAFEELDEQPGAEPVAILTSSLWRQRFDADPSILGRAIRVDGVPHTVVGVVDSTPLLPADLVLPLPRTEVTRSRSNLFLQGIVRIREDASLEQARAEATAVAAGLAEARADTNAGWGFHLQTLHSSRVGGGWVPLALLFGIVGAVLLIACANVTNILLARAASRSREIAVRAALGAGRGRILRQLLTESLVLALGGGLAGVGLAALGVRALRSRLPGDLPGVAEANVDATVLGFTLGVALLTGLVFGAAPALRAARSDLVAALKTGGSGGLLRDRPRRALVVGEIGLAVMLLVIAALLVDSLVDALRADLGFDPEARVVMRLDPPYDRYPPAALEVLIGDLLRGVAQVPGVGAVAVTSQIPMSSSRTFRGFKIEGAPDPPVEEVEYANWISVTPGYFEALGMRLRAGRTFDGRDSTSGEPTIVLNEELARRLFGPDDPIGRRVHIWTDEEQAREVVGVVADIDDRPYGDGSTPQYFTPLGQAYSNRLSLVVRTEADRAAVVAGVRDLLLRADPDLPVYDVRSLSEVFAASIEVPRAITMLATAFALLALALALVGLYGVIAYSVTCRRHELGVRIALGANSGRVRGMVVADALRLGAWGTAIGVAIALLGAALAARFVPDMPSIDPVTVAAVIAIVLAATMVASYVPARRATGVDPLAALRTE